MTALGPFGSENGRAVGRYMRAEMMETGDGRIIGYAPASDYLRTDRGSVHAAAIFTLLDTVGGICSGLAALPEGWIVSTNLAARLVAREHHGPFRLEARVLRRGRNNVVTTVRAVDEGAADACVADGVLTSAILIPEGGPPHWDRPLRIETGAPETDAPHLRDWLGVREVDTASIEIDLADVLRNPWGILHGGVVAALVDLAASHATGGGTTTDMVLHFLAPNRTGPVRATASALGTRSDGTVCRVEVTDAGAPRVTALAVATARA